MAEYLFESARVRVLENSIVGRERLEYLLQAKDLREAVARLGEMGIEPVTDADGHFLREDTLLGVLHRAYGELADLISQAPELRLWLYQYDCNNVKAAIKGFARKIDPRSMMFDFGTLDVKQVIGMTESGKFDALPANMAKAAAEAVTAYAKNRNPQQIDLLLDKACFADMLAEAEKGKVPFAKNLVKEKIDLTNLLMTVRILRRGGGKADRDFLEAAMIAGGKMEASYFLSLYDMGEEKLWSKLYYSEYGRISKQLSDPSRTLTDIEREADNFWMESIRQANLIPYGSEVLVAFLLAHEYEVRNLRILLAGKEAGLSNETIRERIRNSYV